MAVARSGFVSLDCADPAPLAEFWVAMLGGEIIFTSDTTIDIRTEWVWLSAMKIPDYVPPTWPAIKVAIWPIVRARIKLVGGRATPIAASSEFSISTPIKESRPRSVSG